MFITVINPRITQGWLPPPAYFGKFPTDFLKKFSNPLWLQLGVNFVRGSLLHILMYSGLKLLNRLPDYT
jgi:hypothetical protein